MNNLLSLLTVALTVVMTAHQALCEPLLLPTDRILFVGDSITGHSMNLKDGYCHQMRWALQQAHPSSSNTLLSLGGSGQGVGSWMSVATRTNAAPSYLDVAGIEVRTTLDAGTDVLVVMLGMNDLLSPYIADTPEGYQAWRSAYTNLIHTVRKRTKPRLVALGTVTLLTEDLASPKNIARAKLNQQVAEIAASEGYLLLQTGEATASLLQRGRALTPQFHVAGDFVHPGGAGHAAIAIAMLKGLGEHDAAQLLERRYLSALIPTNAYPALSYAISPVSPGNDTQTNTYTITYWWNAGRALLPPPTVTLSIPDIWQLAGHAATATSGVFTVTGAPEKIVTELVLRAKAGDVERVQTLAIPAPWRISAGIPNQAAWPRNTFNATNSIQAFDQPLIRGEGFSSPLVCREKTYPWSVYTPSVNYTGGNNPASIDTFAVLFGRTFDALYATRWVHSDKARTIELHLSTSIFAGTIGLTIWMNGQPCYAQALTSEPQRKAMVTTALKAGWNQLLIKSDHLNWQWQFACDIKGQGADDLSDLRYSAIPQNPVVRQ